jgi:hypothetical protein
VVSYGGSRGSRGADQVGPSLLLLGVLSGAVACSEGSTDPLTLAGAGGTDNGGAGGAVAAGGSSGGFSGSSGGFSGSTAAGGTAGSAGSGNPPATQVYDFTEGLEGFRISYYCLGPGANVACSSVDPAASVDDAGEPAASDSMLLGDFVLATHDAAVGSPAPSAKVELRFSAMGQIAELAVNIDSTDLTGKVLTAQVLMDEGGVPQTAGKLYVKTGPGYVFVDQGEITLTAGTWTTLTFSMPSAFYDPSTYDMTDVREIGIEFATPLAMAFSTTVLHVDNVQY